MIGQILGERYEIIEKIGEGGMSIVYKAKCHLLNRFVAIKVLKKEFVDDEEFVAKFDKESQASASLSHPNIVNVYDVGVEEDVRYIVMELVIGHTLKDVIKNKKTYFDNEFILDISTQIAEALEHAHENGIVHRDIKPHNILITNSDHVKVADFGIARAVTSSTIVHTNDVVGSVHYASPEQARGAFIDARSDIYSLGVVMYELATGRVPFDADTPISVALKHLKEDVIPPSLVNMNLNKSLEGLILKCMQKDANLRYQKIDELIDDLNVLIKNPDEELDLEVEAFMDSHTMKMPNLKDYDVDMNKDNKKKQKRKRKASPIGIVFAMIAAFVLSLLIMMSIFYPKIYDRQRDKEFILEDFTNKNYTETSTYLNDLGIRVDIEEERYSDDVPAQFIIAQSPQAGVKIKNGMGIKVILSLGPRKAIIPNVRNKELSEAKINIENSGLQVGSIEYTFSDLPANYVIDQDPSNNMEVSQNSKVNLTVSQGKENKTVLVPDLRGKTLTDVKDILSRANLRLGGIEYEYDDEIAIDLVKAQGIKGGSEVNEGTYVSIIMSMGPEFPEEAVEEEPTVDDPEGTPDDGADTGSDATGPIEKPYVIPLPSSETSKQVTVMVTKIMDTGEAVVYESSHSTDEKFVKVIIKDKGLVRLNFYIDGELLQTKEENFE